jgi:endonuclease-3
MLKKQHISKIFEILSSDNPAPQTELNYLNNFTLLVAVVLSAQSTDISVNKATKDLFPKYNTPESIFSLGVDGLKEYIKTIGLYNNKAKNVIKLCENLIELHNSAVPDNYDHLIALPGVGRKTANVILNCAFGKETIAVDTHVYRLARRIGLSNGSSTLKVEQDLLQNIPKKWRFNSHHWLILHGRYVCKAIKPLCHECKINRYCDYYITNSQ